METYGKILLIAIPIFLILVLFEKFYGWYKGKDTVRTIDMIASLSSGITNVTKDVLGLGFAIITYGWMESHFALVHTGGGWISYVIAFVALDLSGYWVHRIQHTTNFFWNAHLIHHSSEEFNLACGLRQSISVFFRIFTLFLLPAALLGVDPKVIAIVGPLHLFIQFWYHTQHIGKMGWLEKVIVTPSHHRVHHAINPEYLDKNYSQVFIIWDKLFGTFQEEKVEIAPIYGITRPASTWNPIKINFQHLWLLMKDSFRTKQWKDKFRIWFMPTGWRPADVAEMFPVAKVDNVYLHQKYNPIVPTGVSYWSMLQLLILLGLLLNLFAKLALIGSPGIFIYGGFIFLYIYAMTELMDGSPNAWHWEALKIIAGISIIRYCGCWPGFNASSLMNNLLMIYFLIALVICIAFCFNIPSRVRNVWQS